MKRNTRKQLMIGTIVMMGLLALLQYWLAANRPAALFHADVDFIVSSPADRGPGSLREAIFAADTAGKRARIVIQSQPIVLENPLPPLVNPAGIIVEGDNGLAEINAAELERGAVLDIASPYSIVSGVKITGAREQAILARAEGLRLTKLTLVDCDLCVAVAGGVGDLAIDESRFENNRIGIWLAGDNPGIVIHKNQFSADRDAAVWAVRSTSFGVPLASKLQISENHFDEDRMSLVLGNVPALVENNQITRAREVAVYLIGEGAIVRGNHISDGSGVGIFAHTTQGAIIQGNEMDHNRALGVLVRSTQNSLVENNKVYGNGYGIASVLGDPQRPNVVSQNLFLSQQFDGLILIGDSPVVRGNSMMDNRLAGLRILDFLPSRGMRVNSQPFLAANKAVSNKFNEPIHGEYQTRDTARERARDKDSSK